MVIVFIGLILSIIYIWFALARPRMAFNLTLFISLLWPSYIVYKVEPFPGITPDRLFIVIIFLSFLVNFLFSKHGKYIFSQYSKIIVLLAIYFCWQLLCSLFMSTNLVKSVFGVLNDFSCGIFLTIYLLYFVSNDKQLYQIVKVIFVVFVIINIIGLLELYKGSPLFTKYMISVTDYNKEVIDGSNRAGKYRLMSVYSNALVYSQILVFSIPMLICFIKLQDNFNLKLIAIINMILTYVLIYFTDSRAGLALSIAAPFLFIYLSIYKNNKYKTTIKFVNYILLPIFIFGMTYYLYTLLSVEVIIDWLTVDAGEGSALYRLMQLQAGGEAVMNSPVFGYSRGDELTAIDKVRVIDNHYLSIALASGLVGLSIYLYINFYILNKAIKAIKLTKDVVLMYFISAFVLLLLYYIILSITEMNTIYYVMMAMILIRCKNLEKNYEYK